MAAGLTEKGDVAVLEHRNLSEGLHRKTEEPQVNSRTTIVKRDTLPKSH